jgi:DNA-binding response OmpR family regulator
MQFYLHIEQLALLEFLAGNKGVVLSRDRIEQKLFSYDYMGASNMVDVYIRYLRKKIDEGFGSKLIHTVRGVGYVLREEA